MLHAVIHHLKTLTRAETKQRSKRDSVILLTILVGVVSELFIFSFNWPHSEHYLIGFFRTFFLLMLTYYSLIITKSVRLFTFMVILAVSMSFDVLVFTGEQFYTNYKELIYGKGLSFANVYRTFEVLCLLFTAGRILNLRFIDDIIWNVIICLGRINKRIEANKT